MFLLAPPFISDWLIHTLQAKQYPLIKHPEAFNLLKLHPKLNWIDETEAIKILSQSKQARLYSNSENALDWLFEKLPEHPFTTYSRAFKDKAHFRELIKDLYPDFYFQRVAASSLKSIDPKNLPYPIVLKPTKGFFSIGVHLIANAEDWVEVCKELKLETEDNIYPESVLSKQDLLIESFIEGKEYAVDCYFNNKGEAVITNILLHRFGHALDTSDRLYTTSQSIIQECLPSFTDLLQNIGDKMNIKNYPLHIEVRVTANGEIIPIEVNPLRFGGWCTTADLSNYGHGFNAYEYVMDQKKPDWDTIFKDRKDEIQTVVVLNNSTGLSKKEIQSFDYDLLEQDLSNIQCLRKMDIHEWPVFGFVFTRTPKSLEYELDNIMKCDLKKYVS